ncbi:hypothetical protein PS903_05962 [Pseudomonas fluorescens]|nr:hypothetical protein PS903_05962 [Pseudomonas fluorescens]
MRNFKRVLLAVVALMLVLAILVFVLENQQSVSLVFVGWSTPQWAVSVYILGALLLGLAVGPLLGLVMSRRNKHRFGRSSSHVG